MNLKVSSISKKFNNKKIFTDINFELNKGDLLLLGGNNGIGKSTLLKVILGIIFPDNGSINLNGTKEIKKYVGYSSSNERSFFLRLSANRNLEFFLGMRGFSSKEIRERIHFFSDLFQIDKNVLNKKYMYLSSGEKKRISLIRAFIHEPKLIILDEPSVSLDMHSRNNLLNLLQSQILLSKESMCILASHSLQDFFKISSKFLILGDGDYSLLNRNQVKDYHVLENLLL